MKQIYFAFALLLSVHISHSQVRVLVHRGSSSDGILSGRLFIYTQNDTAKPVPNEPDPFNPQPMFAIDVDDWEKGEIRRIDNNAAGFPLPIDSLQPGYYNVAAFFDAHPEERGGYNTGNLYSRKESILHVDEHGRGETDIVLNATIRERTFTENDSIKLAVVRSTFVSDFQSSDAFIKAGIKLPGSYSKEPHKTYPVVFIIPGWGGTHYDILRNGPHQRYGMGIGKEKIFVYLNPETNSRYGLHAFVDSRVNGPWGKALVEEFIPYLQSNYRVNSGKFFVMGQSSGGYGALWLQLHYPEIFSGCWAVSPDPVDFSEFIGINVYHEKANFYTASDGTPIPFFFMNGNALSTVEKTVAIEEFNGDGGQVQSFEAEFGLPDADGRPLPLFDRKSGSLYAATVEQWKRYDLGLYIQHHWKTLSVSLAGKVHVYAGSDDNFLLDRAVTALGKKAHSVGADVIAEIIPGANHWSIWNDRFTEMIQDSIDRRISD